MFGGNVLDAVVHLLEVAAAGQIARGGEVAALVDPHIPPIGFKIEVGQHIIRHIQQLHVLHIDAPQRFIVGHAWVQLVAVQIVNKVDDVRHAGSMVALVERSLQRFDLVAVQLGNEMRQMVQLVQVFILGEIVV